MKTKNKHVVTVSVFRDGVVIDTVRRAVKKHKRDQYWSVVYKGKHFMVMGSCSGAAYIDADSPVKWLLG